MTARTKTTNAAPSGADPWWGGDELVELPADSPDALERLNMIEALAKLSDEHREAVVAIHLTGDTYAEFSERSGVPVTTLRTRVFYALRALREHIEGKDERRA